MLVMILFIVIYQRFILNQAVIFEQI
jgi:hypothetical protein